MKRIKSFLLVAASIFTFQHLNAQAPGSLWSKNAGGTSDEMGWATAFDGGGNSYVTGSFASSTIAFGAITLTNTGTNTSDIFLVKYDPSGAVLWAKSFGTINDDEGRGIVIEGSGNLYFTGYFHSAPLPIGNFTLTNNGNDDYFVAKVGPTGTVLWAQSAGNVGDNRPGGIALGDFGTIAVAGGYNNTPIVIGTYTLPNKGDFDIFVAQYDKSTGNPTWAEGYGSTGRDGSNAIHGDASGFMIAGAFKGSSIVIGSNTLTNTNSGTNDALYFRINNNNVVSDVGQFGGSGDDQANNIISWPSSGPVSMCVVGEYASPSLTTGSITLTNTGFGTSDMFIVGLSTFTGAVWAKSFGGADDEGIYGLTRDTHDNIFVTGGYRSTTLSIGTTTLTNAASASVDIFVAGFDNSGNSLWAQSFGGTGNDLAFCLKLEEPNGNSYNLFLTGWFGSPTLTFGTNPQLVNAAFGSYNMLFSKLSSLPTGIQETGKHALGSIYPNPTNGEFILSLNDPKPAIVTLYNVAAQKISVTHVNSSFSRFDVPALPDGVYFVEIIQGENVSRIKLVKQ